MTMPTLEELQVKLIELEFRQSEAERMRQGRVQHLECVSDLELLRHGEDIVLMKNWGPLVYMGNNGNIHLLGAGHNGATDLIAEVYILPEDLRIVDGEILSEKRVVNFSSMPDNPKYERILRNCGVLY